MKVSRPQFRIYPTEKWGRPADSVTQAWIFSPLSLFLWGGLGSAKVGDKTGKSADFI